MSDLFLHNLPNFYIPCKCSDCRETHFSEMLDVCQQKPIQSFNFGEYIYKQSLDFSYFTCVVTMEVNK